jgi:hypothetical protein
MMEDSEPESLHEESEEEPMDEEEESVSVLPIITSIVVPVIVKLKNEWRSLSQLCARRTWSSQPIDVYLLNIIVL